MKEFNDWSTHLLSAERLLRTIENKLLNNRREGIEEDVEAVTAALQRTLLWITQNPDR